VLPPKVKAGDLPVPDGIGLAWGVREVLAASSGASGLMPGALLVRLSAGLRKEKKEN
jgi:hypothetical protein